MAIVYDADGVAGKICNKCGEWKPVSEFHRSSKARNGHKADCKTCRNTMSRAYDAARRDQNRLNAKPKPKPAITGKVCVGCQEWKPVSEFSPLRSRGKAIGNGYKSRCKACSNMRQRAKRATDPEQYRNRAREYIASRRDQSNEYQRTWRDKSHEKVKASGRTFREANREKIRIAASGVAMPTLNITALLGAKLMPIIWTNVVLTIASTVKHIPNAIEHKFALVATASTRLRVLTLRPNGQPSKHNITTLVYVAVGMNQT